jgi:broad specificity phosphatase PhoE
MPSHSPKKTLILIRHAHRDVSDRDADNGLSEKGREQAQAIAEHFSSELGKAATPLMLSSAKRRCQETLAPLADALGVEVKVHADLMEQKHFETEAHFTKRIDAFLEEWRTKLPETTIVCSHGDWLPIAAEKLTGKPVDFKKGDWRIVKG